ncbi:hypothetical protein RHMOL_Rhmol08G0203100 [Rhododendron molle]|uniref:Uncharacterized protein n=2 Tax=Rhododendron molle TaxID=49168 RepID=A0ACC0MRK7_RHOML|nr:hypothetical protein RHMOL_Rhmol08G0203100 [Rhododendron molle]
MQDAQVCVVVVPEQDPKLPKEGVDYLVLEDPLGMVLTRASLGYEMKLDFWHFVLDDFDSWCALGTRVTAYVGYHSPGWIGAARKTQSF